MEKMNKKQMSRMPYKQLAVMLGVSFVAMYVLMYAMVDSLPHVYASLNQAYMAGLMTAPMALIELVIMRAMYADKRLNSLVVGGALLVLIGCWTLIRQQTAITDAQFLRSMIPHHAGAILMCKEAPLTDPAVKELCRGIVTGQQSEIEQMQAILSRLGR